MTAFLHGASWPAPLLGCGKHTQEPEAVFLFAFTLHTPPTKQLGRRDSEERSRSGRISRQQPALETCVQVVFGEISVPPGPAPPSLL